MEEIWKQIAAHPEYEVSNHGRVKNARTNRVLAPIKHPRGYVKVSLRGSNYRQCLVHRLVAATFLGPAPFGYSVNHKDGVKNYNHVSNLEYMTIEDNIKHATEVLLRNCGENNITTRITTKEVTGIRAWRATGARLAEIAALYDCSFQHVSDICLGKRRVYA